jgi:hypothetical protein
MTNLIKIGIGVLVDVIKNFVEKIKDSFKDESVDFLDWEQIKVFFKTLKARNQEKLSQENKIDFIGFVLIKADEPDVVYQGIFNKRTNEVIDGIKLKVKMIDADVAKALSKTGVIIFN